LSPLISNSASQVRCTGRKTRSQKTNPRRIGFVHFGEPEEDYLDEYIQFMLNTDIDDDELHVGFTGDLPF
jgi:hypothetical protein